jgi:type IV pilus assembly protein PilW
VLGSNAANSANAYAGVLLRLTAGTGAGQYRSIDTYNGGTRIATVRPAWTTIPDATTRYSLELSLSTSAFPLHQRNCAGTGAPASLPVTAGTAAERRSFVSNLYYVANLAHPERAGELLPTLMRARLGLHAGMLSHGAPAALIEGVEALRIEVGIDDLSETGANVDFTQAVAWADPDRKSAPTNRGDGTADRFMRCTASTPCTAAQLMNTVAVKLWVLARSRVPSPGYVDRKVYCVGSAQPDGTCPAASTIDAANDGYKRHVFSTTVRLINVSGRRETPFP